MTDTRVPQLQDFRLVQVQPQSVFPHPSQHRIQAVLKGLDSIHCRRVEEEIELSVIRILVTQSSKTPDDLPQLTPAGLHN